MFTLIIIFIASGLLLAGMVSVRIWQIGTGRVAPREAQVIPFSMLVEEMWKKVQEHARRLFIIETGRALIRTTRALDWAKDLTRRQVVKMEEKLAEKSSPSKKQGAVSLFLKDIAEHKKIMKVKIRRQAREDNN